MADKKSTRNTPADDASCPYCGKVISPKPARHRKCPHCRQPIRVRRGALMTEQQEKRYDAELRREHGTRRKSERAQMNRITRESNREELQQLRQLQRETGLPIGVEILAIMDADTCSYCASRNEKVAPVDRCTAKNIPPWAECTSESGCRCTIISAMGSAVPQPQPRARKTPSGRRTRKPSGCLLASFAAGLALLLIVSLCSIW